MSLELTFHGAAGAVTGSCMELSIGSARVLIDCGLFQGSRSLEALNYEALPFDARALDAVILTHAHLDHSGRLPVLARDGFSGTVWCTPPTRHLIDPLLLDAAKLQAADAERRNDRPDRAGLPEFEPLYDQNDVHRVVELVEGVSYGKWVDVAPGISFRFWDARHILGSASVEIRADGQSLLFSGDIGPPAADGPEPLQPDAGAWDHIICEATYGDRDRVIPTLDERRELLAKVVEGALARGGNLLIPAFALERTQVLLEDLVALFVSGRLTPSPIYVDAPLAGRITQAYRRHAASRKGPSPFDHPKVKFTPSVDESMMLNRVSGAIIIAGSGMCSGGRIRYHLLRNLPRSESTLLFVGYQARGTLGAVLQSGAKAVRISGADVHVRSHIETIDAYSGHADHAGLLRWLTKRAPVTGSIFLDHGEQPALKRLAKDTAAIPGMPRPIIPLLGERFELLVSSAAGRVGAARPDAHALAAGEDWRNRLASFRANLEGTLLALPSDLDRARALEAARIAMTTQGAEGGNYAKQVVT